MGFNSGFKGLILCNLYKKLYINLVSIKELYYDARPTKLYYDARPTKSQDLKKISLSP